MNDLIELIIRMIEYSQRINDYANRTPKVQTETIKH
jgi:hypothetical protein